jgi:hypothetical protein
MKLAWKLGLDMRSPTAASIMRDVLACDARVQSLLDEVDASEVRAVAARWSGAGVEPAQAPKFGATAPNGTVKLSSMINPMNTASARHERAKALGLGNQ